jgi:hypothetical protein
MKKNKNKSLDYKRIIMILVMVISIGIFITTAIYSANKISEHKKIANYRIINTSVEISTTSGLNGDRDGLKYGKTTPGGSGLRYLEFNTTEDVLVNIYISGDMSKFLSVDENNFIMQANTNKSLPVYLTVPLNTSYGFYEGKIKVIMTRI